MINLKHLNIYLFNEFKPSRYVIFLLNAIYYNINDKKKILKTIVTLININNVERTFARSNVYFTFEYNDT